MTEFEFDPNGECIVLKGVAFGPHRRAELKLILDTGATRTILSPEIIDRLGYSARDGHLAFVSSPIGRESGYRLRLQRFECLGHGFDDFEVLAFELFSRGEYDGLLGLDFLRRFNYQVLSRIGRIRVEPA